MTLGGAFPSALGWDRCSGSPARWWTEPPVGEKQKCFRNRQWSLQFKSRGWMKRLPSVAWPHECLWASTLCFCLERDSSFFKGVTTKPVFSWMYGWYFLCTKHTVEHNSAHTQYTQSTRCAWGNERVSPPEWKPNRVGVWDGQIVFLSAKVQTSKNLPMWGKCLPISTQRLSPLPPLSIPTTALPLNVFTFSSFDCGQTALFYSTRERRIPGLSPSQAELNTAPTGVEECVTGTLKSQ